MSAARPRVLFISPDAVGERMAGLGIRYTELARVLAADAEVVIATGVGTGGDEGFGNGVRVVPYDPHDPRELRPWIAWCDTAVAPPQWPVVTGWLRSSGKRIVFDLYDPETLETLELFAGRRRRVRRLMVTLTLDRLHDAIRTGHHFMCASEAQRDLWIGVLLGGRALTPAAYDADRTLRGIIDLVPFGLPAAPPTSSGGGVRAAFPEVGERDEVVLWNGGVWPWLDAPTAIRAVARLAACRPSVRLVFMGRGTGFAGRAAFEQAEGVARDLGILGRNVLFATEWVPYEQRADWLRDADCALATAGDHLESRYAFRTRMLDCFWSGLPVVCTAGDDLAGRVARDGLGGVARTGDDEALAAALGDVLERGKAAYAPALAGAAAEHTWSAVSRPLSRWVHAGDAPTKRFRGARRPGHLARSFAYRTTRTTLVSIGIGWPSQ